jgi:hypothetical protein
VKPWSSPLVGRIEEHWIESRALAGNPLGDPSTRPLWVYLPPGYDADPARRVPSVYAIQGLTGQLDMWRNRAPFRPTYPEMVDALFARGEAPPCLVVFVDAWTSLGGSQFLDSPATGRYHTYLCDEVVPWVDARYRTLASAAHRGIAGKSSGGYGALVTPMLRPDLFGGLASHAGDSLFEVSYWPDVREAARALRDEYQGSYERFWGDFRARPALSKKSDLVLLNVWCMAACYSADPDGTVRLPFEPSTGRLVDEVWARWLAWDPVRMAPWRATAIRGLRAVWIDAGRRDEWFLDLGAQAVRDAFVAAGAPEVRFELFDATHAAIEYRYPLALRYLAERLSP